MIELAAKTSDKLPLNSNQSPQYHQCLHCSNQSTDSPHQLDLNTLVVKGETFLATLQALAAVVELCQTVVVRAQAFRKDSFSMWTCSVMGSAVGPFPTLLPKRLLDLCLTLAVVAAEVATSVVLAKCALPQRTPMGSNHYRRWRQHWRVFQCLSAENRLVAVALLTWAEVEVALPLVLLLLLLHAMWARQWHRQQGHLPGAHLACQATTCWTVLC